MKPFLVVTCAFLILLATSCDPVGESPGSEGPASEQAAAAVERFARELAEQDRVNRYFHDAVVTGLTGCWSELQGEGSVFVRVDFRREGRAWTAGAVEVEASTLPADQGETAARCVEQAVAGTSFAARDADAASESYEVHWGLPVPWPDDVEAYMARMIDTGGGGGNKCGGPEGPPPACQDCFFMPIVGWSYCGRTCSGYKNCVAELNGCRMGPLRPLCVTVSPFFNSGGAVIY